MSERIVIQIPPPRPPKKPLRRLQQYLRELKVCTELCRELLLALKDVLSVITLIVFFMLGVYEAIHHLFG